MTQENFTLQLAKKHDLKQIAQIYAKEFSKYPYNEPWTPKIALYKLKTFSKYTDIYKIEKQKEIIGFIIINTNIWFPKSACLIEEFTLSHKYQNDQLEKKVLQTTLKIYKEKGYPSFLTITKKNSKYYKLAKNLNFKETKEDVIMEHNL